MEAQEKQQNLQNLNNKIEQRNFTIPVKAVIALFVFTVVTAVVLETLPIAKNYLTQVPCNSNATVELEAPKYAIYGKSRTEEHLIHVFNVLERFGYKRVTLESDWDILWAHDYPFFVMREKMKSLKAHQMVNHMPGCGFLTNKVDLSTTALPFLPSAFRLPKQREEFIAYTQTHTNALFVEKHNEHRHIVIRAPEAINLEANSSFVQEFVQHPYLVDGYKFDIGVYVLITSIDPLLAYIYKGDVLFRYCAQPYHPFDKENVDKYVVGDDYLPTWEVPSLRKYFNTFRSNMRDAFDAYVRDQSQDPTIIWQQVEHIVRETLLVKHADMASILKKFKTGKFFELLRFDMIIDENLRVHLMEANMSPNLSSAHFKQNSLLYEQILYSALHVVGVGSAIKINNGDAAEMITAERNLVINLNNCAKNNCDKSCQPEICDFCSPCLSGREYDKLAQAHQEHLHKVDMHRIFPHPNLNSKNSYMTNDRENLSPSNKWLSQWFYAKCIQDQSYC